MSVATREDNLKYRYGIDQEEYDAILKAQKNKCKICDTKHTGHKPLCVDHCHNSTRVRGLLCKKCNTSLGLLKEDPKILVNAILYLDEYHKQETRAFSEAIGSLAKLSDDDGAGKSISCIPKPYPHCSKDSNRGNDRIWHSLILGEDDEPIERISTTSDSDEPGRPGSSSNSLW
tara:strand:+ start:1153 stop:1674 length:522 start_codon:yes stop_codon:yes gene_type:complete